MFSGKTPKAFKVPPDWVYRGEGNCNVVIALPRQRKILRLRKMQKCKTLLGWLIEWITDILVYLYYGNYDEETRDIEFYRKIVRPLIGQEFVCDADQVFVSKKQIKILECKLTNQRPGHRKNKSLQYGRAALFEDYAYLPNPSDEQSKSNTFAIEIKPKQGWIPFSEKHYPECVFCMNQYLKLKTGQAQELSGYCPLDLFSGEEQRMFRAIKALIKNPQNNLKIFKNGQLCYSEKHPSSSFDAFIAEFFGDECMSCKLKTEEFCKVIRLVLLNSFEKTPSVCDRKMFCEWNKIIQGSKLPRGSVLEKILSAQMLDTEGHQYYYKLLGSKNLMEYCYVKSLLKKVAKADKGTCLKCSIMMLADEKAKEANVDLALAPYLISAIAKDCSLMLTFRKFEEADLSSKTSIAGNVVHTRYGSFLVNVGVLDLYPKPVSTIFKHKNKIEKITQLYLERNQKK